MSDACVHYHRTRTHGARGWKKTANLLCSAPSVDSTSANLRGSPYLIALERCVQLAENCVADAGPNDPDIDMVCWAKLALTKLKEQRSAPSVADKEADNPDDGEAGCACPQWTERCEWHGPAVPVADKGPSFDDCEDPWVCCIHKAEQRTREAEGKRDGE